jgi:hypothetical protein
MQAFQLDCHAARFQQAESLTVTTVLGPTEQPKVTSRSNEVLDWRGSRGYHIMVL